MRGGSGKANWNVYKKALFKTATTSDKQQKKRDIVQTHFPQNGSTAIIGTMLVCVCVCLKHLLAAATVQTSWPVKWPRRVSSLQRKQLTETAAKEQQKVDRTFMCFKISLFFWVGFSLSFPFRFTFVLHHKHTAHKRPRQPQQHTQTTHTHTHSM